jgi:hypothetical protein
MFGYRLPKPDGRYRSFYFAGFEADTGSEQLTGFERETIETKIAAYDRFFDERPYRDTVPNCSAAFVCMSETRANNIVNLIRQKSSQPARYIATWLPDFLDNEFEEPSATMVTRQWLTTDGTLSIMDVLERR